MNSMSGSIFSLKKSRWIPAISILTIILLLSGGIFNCCHINEAYAQSIKHAFQALGWQSVSKDMAVSEDAENTESQSHCHIRHDEKSNSTPAKQHAIKSFDLGAKNLLTTNENCLSNSAWSSKPMVNNTEFSLTLFPVSYLLTQVDIIPVLPSRIDLTRPQNKSSPPVYLLTLHILV
jgi:chromosomal replication initiation ATPase DnaA